MTATGATVCIDLIAVPTSGDGVPHFPCGCRALAVEHERVRACGHIPSVGNGKLIFLVFFSSWKRWRRRLTSKQYTQCQQTRVYKIAKILFQFCKCLCAYLFGRLFAYFLFYVVFARPAALPSRPFAGMITTFVRWHAVAVISRWPRGVLKPAIFLLPAANGLND